MSTILDRYFTVENDSLDKIVFGSIYRQEVPLEAALQIAICSVGSNIAGDILRIEKVQKLAASFIPGFKNLPYHVALKRLVIFSMA